MPFGREPVVIDTAAAIEIVSELGAEAVLFASVAVTVTFELPAAVGVPVIAPVWVSRFRPDGSPVAVQV